MESQDIEVNSHIRRNFGALSDQSDFLGPGGCGFDDNNEGVVKAVRSELETKERVYKWIWRTQERDNTR